jgi:tetratricopeptide (TPR) repeat protein
MLRFRPPEGYPEFRGFWIALLTMWEDACNWYGYIQGSLGSLWAAKALREIFRLSEAWHLFNSSASVIASNLYALATSIEAKAECEEYSEWKRELSNQAREFLSRSLNCVNISFHREPALSVSTCSIRGNIYRKLGNYEEAIRSHRMALQRCTSDESRGMQISHMGRARILCNDKEGLSYLDEAVAICRDIKSPSEVRTLKALGQGLIVLKEYDRAEEITNKACELAEKRKLGHQLESLRTMKTTIVTKKRN